MFRENRKQAEAEVVPSSSLVEVEVDVGVEVDDEVEVGVEVEDGVEAEVEVGVGVWGVRVGVGLTFSVGWGGKF